MKSQASIEQNVSTKDLLQRKLTIPDYQRGYCWRTENVKALLLSLMQANRNLPYHLGIVVLRKKVNGDLEIVDGQQRLLTLALLIHRMNIKLTLPVLECKTNDIDVQRHFANTCLVVDEWLAAHKEFYNARDFLVSKVWFSCVEIVSLEREQGDYGSLQLAYTFFNAINSVGKKLTDFELLKAHHLRYVDAHEQERIRYYAAMWDELCIAQVDSFNENRSDLIQESLGCSLYLIRSWLRHRNINLVNSVADVPFTILKHYSAYNSVGSPMQGIKLSFKDGIVGGKSFFDFALDLSNQYKVFISIPEIQSFLNAEWSYAQLELKNIARAILFFYFLHFGTQYIADAILFVLHRVGRLRNQPKNLKAWYNTDQLSGHTIDVLDESPTPEFFFKYCGMQSNRYSRRYVLRGSRTEPIGTSNLRNRKTHVPNYWVNLLKLVSSNSEFHGIGASVCFKKDIYDLYYDVAKDFAWSLNDELMLKEI